NSIAPPPTPRTTGDARTNRQAESRRGHKGEQKTQENARGDDELKLWCRRQLAREVAGPRLDRRAPVFQLHIEPVPSAGGDAPRRVADQIAVSKLLEDAKKRGAQIARRVDLVQRAAG